VTHVHASWSRSRPKSARRTYADQMIRRSTFSIAITLAVFLSTSVPSFASVNFAHPTVESSASQAPTNSTRYTSCKKLRKVFPRGVSKNQVSRNAALAQGYGPSAINTSAYLANKELDKNGNRVACEVSAAKARKNFRSELLKAELPLEQAKKRIEKAGYMWRVGLVDGEAMVVTQDYRLDRLTLSVNKGTLTNAEWG